MIQIKWFSSCIAIALYLRLINRLGPKNHIIQRFQGNLVILELHQSCFLSLFILTTVISGNLHRKKKMKQLRRKRKKEEKNLKKNIEDSFLLINSKLLKVRTNKTLKKHNNEKKLKNSIISRRVNLHSLETRNNQ